ncbi:MAG: hypothetical protein ACTJGG_10125 [Marinomonas foliarum]
MTQGAAANESWVLGSETFIEQFKRRVGIAGKTAEHGGIGNQSSFKKTALIP